MLPGCRIVDIVTNEFDELNECAAGWSLVHQPLKATCHSDAFLVMTPSLQVGHIAHSAAYTSQGQAPRGSVVMGIPLDQSRPMLQRGQVMDTQHPGLLSSGQGFECVCRAGARFLTVVLANDTLERYAADLWHEPRLVAQAPERLDFLSEAHRARFLDTCAQLLDIAHRDPAILTDGEAARILEAEVVQGLFLNARPPGPPREVPGRREVARRAYALLQESTDQVPSIRDLCAFTGASYSTLERGFLELYGMRPKALTTGLRLSRVRRTLRTPGLSATVTAVALRWGFVEFGRFSALYHQRYGELPSETLRRTHEQAFGVDASARQPWLPSPHVVLADRR
ncbi:hypothetical protein TBR22_A12630 [Luteitalea sp. TBR-22]|uniref:helix-turn-helix domain-containing protein n=1 Tax=Luteitalea sp. TBR-22 TaxID=2802971 RepID=UPI001AF427D5|nr:helix-turn-helix domain-containing protein [Luteitalea sp. TBR-22]BCS32058.1 hypothetical protein TBR22_A12630 [Luteitalea sp. TBR-22]